MTEIETPKEKRRCDCGRLLRRRAAPPCCECEEELVRRDAKARRYSHIVRHGGTPRRPRAGTERLEGPGCGSRPADKA
jgi:hypothetical protein